MCAAPVRARAGVNICGISNVIRGTGLKKVLSKGIVFCKSLHLMLSVAHLRSPSLQYAHGHSNGAALVNKLAVNGVGASGISASATQLIESPAVSSNPAGSSFLQNTLPNAQANTPVPMLCK